MAKRKQISRPDEKLFANSQMDMFEKSYEEQLKEDKKRPVKCLGITFENDEKRREYFLEKLREKLRTQNFVRSRDPQLVRMRTSWPCPIPRITQPARTRLSRNLVHITGNLMIQRRTITDGSRLRRM